MPILYFLIPTFTPQNSPMLKKLLILLFLSQQLQAQIPTDWNAFGQRIDVSAWQGKNFRFRAAVKVQMEDTTASGYLWARVDRENNKLGFFNNMNDKPIRTNEWKTYTIQGKIDKDAKWLNIGGLYYRNGVFDYDDFTLEVEVKKNEWQPLPVEGAGFEADTLSSKWYFFYNRKGFSQKVVSGGSFEGQHHLQVTGKGIMKSKPFGDNPDAGRYAEVNGIRIYYETYGEGEPLLLLHGNRSSISLFQLQIPALEKHYKVIAVDTRGQGKSTEDGKLYTYDLFAEDMNALLNHLHLDSVNVLGWSDGGNTGLIMAMKYPKKVKRLVTMGAVVFIDHTVVDEWVYKAVQKQLKEFKEDTSYTSQNNWRLANLLLTEPNHTFDELKAIQCPVLVMAGEKDVIREEHTKGIASHIPNGTLMIVPKATHEFPTDDPAAFNKAVLEFLKK